MKFIVLNYSYGNGPLARCLDIIYKSIKSINIEKNIGIIIPEFRLTNPKRLIIENFIANSKTSNIKFYFFLCSELSKTRQDLSTNKFLIYDDYLVNLSQNINNIQNNINQYFDGKIEIINMKNLVTNFIEKEDILFCISRCSIFCYPVESIEISYGPQSLIFSKWREKFNFNQANNKKLSLAVSTIIEKYKEVEQKNIINYLSIPSSLTVEKEISKNFQIFNNKKIIFCPPLHSEFNRSKNKDYDNNINKNNVYIYISGTNVLEKTSIINYMNKNLPNKYKRYSNRPELISNSIYEEPTLDDFKFDFVIARAGWGIVWNCLVKSIPLLISPPTEIDDPEIILNYETLLQLELILPISSLKSKSLINELANLKTKMVAYNQSLINTFGTLSGSEYISNHGMINKFILKNCFS